MGGFCGKPAPERERERSGTSPRPSPAGNPLDHPYATGDESQHRQQNGDASTLQPSTAPLPAAAGAGRPPASASSATAKRGGSPPSPPRKHAFKSVADLPADDALTPSGNHIVRPLGMSASPPKTPPLPIGPFAHADEVARKPAHLAEPDVAPSRTSSNATLTSSDSNVSHSSRGPPSVASTAAMHGPGPFHIHTNSDPTRALQAETSIASLDGMDGSSSGSRSGSGSSPREGMVVPNVVFSGAALQPVWSRAVDSPSQPPQPPGTARHEPTTTTAIDPSPHAAGDAAEGSNSSVFEEKKELESAALIGSDTRDAADDFQHSASTLNCKSA